MLTESAKKFSFGHVEPQQRRDYSGPGNSLLYEGYATPGISEDTAGWIIIKHSFNAGNMDTESQPKYGCIWTLRATAYDYNSP